MAVSLCIIHSIIQLWLLLVATEALCYVRVTCVFILYRSANFFEIDLKLFASASDQFS